MVKSQESEDFEQVVEKIVFDEEELEVLKISITKFSEGKIQAKQLKQKLLLCRSRMVKDISNFISFCVDRMQNSSQTPVVTNFTDSNQFDLVINQLRKDISEKNELLEAVRERINALVIKAKKNTVPGKESFH